MIKQVRADQVRVVASVLVREVMNSVENREEAIQRFYEMTPVGKGGVGIAHGRIVRERIALMDEIIREERRAAVHISFYRTCCNC